MLEVAKKIFTHFNNNNINYCHFKSNEHLMAGLTGNTDLDVLFDISQKKDIENIFLKNDFKRFEPYNIGKYPGVDNWYGFDEETGKLIHIHTHYNLISGKGLVKDYYLPWENIFFENLKTEKNTNIKIPVPELEYILLCTRIIIKRNFRDFIKSSKDEIYLDDDFLRELNYLREQSNKEKIKKFLSQLFKKDNIIFNYIIKIERLDKKSYKELKKMITKELKKHRRFPSFISELISIKNKFIRKCIMFSNKKFNTFFALKKRAINKGVTLAFVGIDGSGKSTVSSIIYKWLSSEFDTIKFYAGAGDGKKNKFSAFMLNTYKNNKNVSKHFDDKKVQNAKQKNKLLNKIKNLFGAITYYMILRDNIKHIKKSYKLKEKGCFCIMDRFPQGTVESEHDGPKIQKYLKNKNFLYVKYLAFKERKIFSKLENKQYPEYDIVFKMMITPEIAISRKPEDHDYEDLAKKAKSYNKIKFNAKKTIEIDSSKELDSVVLEVKKNIWKTL